MGPTKNWSVSSTRKPHLYVNPTITIPSSKSLTILYYVIVAVLCFGSMCTLTTTQWVGTTDTPLFTTGTQLEHHWLNSTGLPWAAHWYYWNTLGNTPGETYYIVFILPVLSGIRDFF
jgi:hypothetical protein